MEGLENLRIGGLPHAEEVIQSLLILHEFGYFLHVQEVLRRELLSAMAVGSMESPEFKAEAQLKIPLIQWLGAVENEAATELEKRIRLREQEQSR